MKPVRVTMAELGAMFCTGGRNIGDKARMQQAEHQAKQVKREHQQKFKGKRK